MTTQRLDRLVPWVLSATDALAWGVVLYLAAKAYGWPGILTAITGLIALRSWLYRKLAPRS